MSLEGITAEVDALKGLLGDRGYLAGPSEPTLWGATNGLGSRMDAMETAAGLLHANMENLRSLADTIADKMGQFDKARTDHAGLTGVANEDAFSADRVMRDILNSPDPTNGVNSGARFV